MGKRHGYGELTTQNGDKYWSKWDYGKMNGYTRIQTLNNEIYEGIYKNGFKSGVGRLFTAKGVYHGEYENDEMV